MIKLLALKGAALAGTECNKKRVTGKNVRLKIDKRNFFMAELALAGRQRWF